MFAPFQRAHPLHLLGNDSAVRRRTTAECTQGTSLSAQTVAVRIRSSGSRRTKSSQTCSLDWADIAQQMLDLQMTLQIDARCTARKVNSNLTAGIPAAYHPLTEDGLGAAGAMQGLRLARRRCGSD